MSAGAQPVPQEIKAPAKPLTLAEKLTAKQEALVAGGSKAKANKLKLDFAQDNERMEWSCDLDTFLALIKESSSGDSEGLMLDLSVPDLVKELDGKKYHFQLSHARGGGAWLMSKMLIK